MKLLRCVDPGRELGLELGGIYELVREIDPWTVAVRECRRPEAWPDHVLDTWEHAVWPEAETLSPRMAGRFVEVIE